MGASCWSAPQGSPRKNAKYAPTWFPASPVSVIQQWFGSQALGPQWQAVLAFMMGAVVSASALEGAVPVLLLSFNHRGSLTRLISGSWMPGINGKEQRVQCSAGSG